MAEKFIADKNIHDGHRARMRAKFLAHGSEIFDTYELLEMLLYYVIPYKDTNPIAKRLLFAFDGIDGVLSAKKEELMKVDGIGERAADFLVHAGLVQKVLEIEPLVRKSIFSDYHKVGNFFCNYFKGVEEYKTTLLLLDNKMLPISIIDLFDSDCNHGKVTTYPFIAEAIKEQASVAIVAHTHPHSSTMPCQGDRSTTVLLKDAFSDIGIIMPEHYIISGNEYRGFIDDVPLILSGDSAVEKFLESKPKSNSGTSSKREDFNLGRTKENSLEVKYVTDVLKPVMGEKSQELAHKMYMKYFSFERTMSVSYSTLVHFIGSRCAFYIKLLSKITSRRVTDYFEFGARHSEASIAAYFKWLFIGESVEKLYVMTFDSQNRAISCDLVNQGTVNYANVMPRQILEIALANKAKSAIIAHNHPRGNPTPSRQDSTLTNSLSRILRQANITLIDHFIVSECECCIDSKPYSY